ncbi:hypothetical protein TREMEDRAFT_33113 [Tremella mesenterica DSM 1558]|uniref:uncharacterized protein n=1 Tax=Tremella mesenterica (strain ATCC 24925 / CBS 8224 / DSM 1558 / NBRC 9311 / NRRL Y-6157 / RJB 2259-6 / UBC 559-6) TaxID=578456 RepID=UPI0003F4900D|nr:uncharacterized protein TREMEDRAFT_33113 [Tremella mesenterica DSM 1558]EIW67922.1 hypothetical protein TREMEDRAFT_33113 [Tremella mesenterica DSM 1558]
MHFEGQLPIDKPLNVPDRAHFPSTFLHGYATAATQIEGGVSADGRGPSIWDSFSREPGVIKDNTTTDIATRSYQMWGEDVDLLSQLNANTYRFSISWSRVIPLGDRDAPVNQKGLEYYDRLVDALLDNGITPFVTLHHWDVPLSLQNRYDGWLNAEEMTKDFVRFADVCFARYGDRVKHWVTINEPLTVTNIGYGSPKHAPGYDSALLTFSAGYGMLHAHAHVVDVYRRIYQPTQNGQIGIALCGTFGVPFSASEQDRVAVQAKWDFQWNWFASPIFLTGKYPESMITHYGTRLPPISSELSSLLLGSADFFAFNTYFYNAVSKDGDDELNALTTEHYHFSNGSEFGHPGRLPFLRAAVPKRLYDMVHFLGKTYKKPMYLTEFGFARKNEQNMDLIDAVEDAERVQYLQEALDALRLAVHEGVDLRGCFIWTLTDNWEWSEGFTWRL